MFRRIAKSELRVLRSFLDEDGLKNLFMKADLENMGLSSDVHEFMGSFFGKSLHGVCLRFFQTVYIALNNPALSDECAAYVRQREMVCGLPSAVEAAGCKIALGPVRNEIFAVMDKLEYDGGLSVETASLEDYGRLYDFQLQIEEFCLTEEGRKKFCFSLENGTGRAVFIEKQGAVVSSAVSVAEFSEGAMIVNVATLKEHRGRGYGSACVAGVCAGLLAEGKKPCLFYDAPEAGRIYRKLGFREVSGWASAEIIREEK